MALRRTRTVLLGITGLAIAGSMAGLGTFAAFTDSTTAAQSLATGDVDINLGTEGTADNRLTLGATGMVPGDSVQRRVKLTNDAGNENLASITLTTTSSTSNVLTTDATNGLQMKIEKCSGLLGWRESATTPYTYTCDSLALSDNLGTRSVVLARRQIVGGTMALAGMSALTAGTTDDMVVTVDLPVDADNTFQELASTITYNFIGTQRAAVSK